MPRSESTSESPALARHFRRNLTINLAVDLSHGFALAQISAGIVLAAYLRRLGASNLVIGLAPALFNAGLSFTQLAGVYVTRHMRAKMRIFVTMLIAAFLPWIPVGVLTLWWSVAHPQAMVVALLVLYVLSLLLWGMCIPLWGQLLPRLYPDRRRGIALGLVLAASSLGGIVGGIYVTYVLTRWEFPTGFAILFLTAGIVAPVTRALHYLSVETVPEDAEPVPDTPLLPRLWEVFRSDRRIRRFLYARSIFDAGVLVAGFFAVYSLERFHLPDSFSGSCSLVLGMGTAALAPWAGRLGDVRGYRRVMGWAMVLAVASTGLIVVADTPRMVLAAFFLWGLVVAADGVAYQNLIVEMSTEATRGDYLGLAASVLAPGRLVFPLLWGWIGDRHGLLSAFHVGLALQGVAWLFLVGGMDDPRRPNRRILRWHRTHPWPRFW